MWHEKLAWGTLIAAVIAVSGLQWNELKLERAEREKHPTAQAQQAIQQPAAAAPPNPGTETVDVDARTRAEEEAARHEAARRELELKEYEEAKLARRLEAASSSAQAFAGMMKIAGAWDSLVFDCAPNKLSPNIVGIGFTVEILAGHLARPRRVGGSSDWGPGSRISVED